MNLKYGTDAQLSLDSDDIQITAVCGTPQGAALDDTVAAVAASLVEPIDYPPLVQATVPGDRIALAIHRSVPQKQLVLAGVLQTLADESLDPGEISVVLAPGSVVTQSLYQAVPARLQDRVTIVVHDPEDAASLAYLATTQDGKPVHINRRLIDADVVITVGCIRPTGSGYANAHGGVFPAFADVEMRNRFLAPATGLESRENHMRCREADEVTWLLGARFTVQLIPGAGDQMLKVVSGDMDSVIEYGRDLSNRVWECVVDGEASAVIAAIEGGPDQQTWENVGRAVDAASRIARENGAIVICSELSDPPGPAMAELIGASDPDSVARAIVKRPSYDAESASHVLQAMQRCHVYLLSQLDAGLVEEMGFVPVGDVHEVHNLCQRHGPCILLANAQHMRPAVAENSVSATESTS